jgi:hypothetical protein
MAIFLFKHMILVHFMEVPSSDCGRFLSGGRRAARRPFITETREMTHKIATATAILLTTAGAASADKI